MVTALLDSDALMFDIDGRGVKDLWDEGLSYHWERRETDTLAETVPARIDDDRIAAMEYAIEEMVANDRGMHWTFPSQERPPTLLEKMADKLRHRLGREPVRAFRTF